MTESTLHRPAVAELTTQILERIGPHVVELEHVDVLERVHGFPDLIDDVVLMLLSARLGLGKTH